MGDLILSQFLIGTYILEMNKWCFGWQISNILIHLVCQSVSDKAWEGGFLFSRAQRCRQDGGNGFWMKVGQHGWAGHGRRVGRGDQVLTGGFESFWASWQISSPPRPQTSPVHLTMHFCNHENSGSYSWCTNKFKPGSKRLKRSSTSRNCTTILPATEPTDQHLLFPTGGWTFQVH